MTRSRTVLLLTAALALVLAACGSSDDNPSAATNDKAFVLNEWAITPPTAPLHAGKVEITATNIGGETHELVIVRASDAGSLPTKADGSVDEEMIPEADKPGEIPDIAAGKTVTKTLDLPAGHYVAICNLVEGMGSGNGSMMDGSVGSGSGMGHVHFRLGMKTSFEVT
jgi:hypothetical protein